MAYTAAKQTEYILFYLYWIFEKTCEINMGKSLKVVALVSGGKDSCYSMLQCVRIRRPLNRNSRPKDVSSMK